MQWEDLKPHQLILSGRGSGNRMILDEALRSVNWQPDRPVEIEHLTTSLDLVEAGLGISVVPPSALPGEPQSSMAIRPLVNPTVTRTIGVIRRRGATLAPVAQQFLLAVRRMAPGLAREVEERTARLAHPAL